MKCHHDAKHRLPAKTARQIGPPTRWSFFSNARTTSVAEVVGPDVARMREARRPERAELQAENAVLMISHRSVHLHKVQTIEETNVHLVMSAENGTKDHHVVKEAEIGLQGMMMCHQRVHLHSCKMLCKDLLEMTAMVREVMVGLYAVTVSRTRIGKAVEAEAEMTIIVAVVVETEAEKVAEVHNAMMDRSKAVGRGGTKTGLSTSRKGEGAGDSTTCL